MSSELEPTISRSHSNRPPSIARSTRSHRSIFREEFDFDPLEHPDTPSPLPTPYQYQTKTPSSSSPYLTVTDSNTTRSNVNLNNTNNMGLGRGNSSILTTASSVPTPREVRRLASDHDFVLDANPTAPRLGWWSFMATHLTIPASLLAGIIFVIVAIVYTHATTRQLLECPDWALDCSTADAWTVNHLGTVQGVITFVFIIGMAALAHVALNLCEAAVWPLLVQQVFTIRGLEAYLATVRGTIISAPLAFLSVRTIAAALVLLCAVAVTLLPLAVAPMVGYAFTPTWQDVQFQGNYSAAGMGGITELYAQTAPPTSVLVNVLAEYSAWASDPSSEPLAEYRDWYVDRETLGERGSFSGKAVQLETTVSCVPRRLKQVNRDGLFWNSFETNMTRVANSTGGERNSSNADIWVRPFPQLTLWADDFTFVSERQTKATLIFAALNGSIEGGEWTPIVLGSLKGASAVACDVEITAVDGVLTVGDSFPPSEAPVLSSIEDLQTSPNATQESAINELLLWFAVAPVLVGSSVDGTQPMFFNATGSNLPVPYTGTSAERNSWTIDGIESFIRMSVGALAQATSRDSSPPSALQPVVLASTARSHKLSPQRALLLVIPPVLVVAFALILAVWLTIVHARGRIPVMRMAGPAELLKSAQTQFLREQAGTDAAKAYLPSELGPVEVKYGVDKDGLVGLAGSVRRFDGERKVEFRAVTV